MIGCCGFECCGFDGNNVEEEEENDQHGVIRRLFKLISRKEYIGNSLLVCCVRFLHVSYNSTSNSNSRPFYALSVIHDRQDDLYYNLRNTRYGMILCKLQQLTIDHDTSHGMGMATQ